VAVAATTAAASAACALDGPAADEEPSRLPPLGGASDPDGSRNAGAGRPAAAAPRAGRPAAPEALRGELGTEPRAANTSLLVRERESDGGPLPTKLAPPPTVEVPP